MDREQALDVALGQIERQFGKGAVMKMNDHERAPVRDLLTTRLEAGLVTAEQLPHADEDQVHRAGELDRVEGEGGGDDQGRQPDGGGGDMPGGDLYVELDGGEARLTGPAVELA